jgi:hypothetical protein
MVMRETPTTTTAALISKGYAGFLARHIVKIAHRHGDSSRA